MGKNVIPIAISLIVFLLSVYAASAQTLIGTFEGTAVGDLSGSVVSMSGDGQRIAIASPEADGNGIQRGEVKIFERSNGIWIQLGNTLFGEADYDKSGLPMKLSGDGTTVAIGSYVNSSFAGHVRVYRYNSSNQIWEQLGNTITGLAFLQIGYKNGLDITYDGNSMVIGISSIDRARIYDLDQGVWNERSEINGVYPTSQAGYSISISDHLEYVAMGYGIANNALAFVYRDILNDLVEIISLPSPRSDLTSVTTVNSDGLRLAYAGPEDNSAYVYQVDLNSNLLIQLGSFQGDSSGDKFGSSIDLDSVGHRIAIGAEGHDGNKGLVRVFDYNTSTEEWGQFGQDILGDATGDLFGSSVAISDDGNYLVVGERNGQSGKGIVKVYLLNETNTFSAVLGGSWDIEDNWSLGRVPSEIDNVIIEFGSSLAVDGAIEIQNFTMQSGSFVDLAEQGSVTINGNFSNLSENPFTLRSNNSTNNAASLRISGASNGKIQYRRELETNNWYLVSSPATDETIEDFITSNSLATSGTNIGLAPYANDGTAWNYYQTGQDYSGEAMTSGIGYSLKPSSAGVIQFEGSYPTENVSVSISQGSTNNFNLIGNPYPSYVSVIDLLNENDIINNDFLTEATIWMWNQATSSYDTYNLANSIQIAPCQGFFISANGTHNFNILESMQSHQSNDTFQRHSNNQPKINLTMSGAGISTETDIYYIEGTTTSFDNGYDSTVFSGGNTGFSIYTHLVSDSEGLDFAIQALPPDNYENMIIPVGVNASTGSTLNFHSDVMNLPTGIHVYLEDKEEDLFIQLDEANSNYEVVLSSDQQGIGRFYLHTTSSVLGTADDIELSEKISLYVQDQNILRVVGLEEGEQAEVIIYDILGKQMYSQSIQGRRMNDVGIPHVRDGIYIANVLTNRGKISKKVIFR